MFFNFVSQVHKGLKVAKIVRTSNNTSVELTGVCPNPEIDLFELIKNLEDSKFLVETCRTPNKIMVSPGMTPENQQVLIDGLKQKGYKIEVM